MTVTWSFGEWVRRRRRALDLTQSQLANRVACAVITIRKIESDERRPSRQMAQLLAEALEIEDGSRDEFVATARAYRSPSRLGSPAAEPSQPVPRLAMPLSPLVGREQELDDLVKLGHFAGGEARLMSITGPPGVGKTRLAEELAIIASRDYDVPVIVVPLDEVREPSQVLERISTSMALERGSPVEPLEAAVRGLGRTPALLILDNFEHVADASADVVELLRRCPEVTCVVTSRISLACPGEIDYPLEPLRVPLSGEQATLDDVAEWPAIALFLQSAPYSVAKEGLDLALVAEVCRSLDGLPLAIELAALLTRRMPLASLAAQLPSRLETLAMAARGWPMRRRSVDAAIAWSYDLLSEDAKTALRAASVFDGDFTTASLGAVMARDDGAVMPAVRELLDHSLIRDGGRSGRFRLLAVIRAFAADRLRRAAEDRSIARRHAEHFVAYAEAAAGSVDAWSNDEYMESLDREEANVTAAFSWAFGPVGDAQLGRRLLAATGAYLAGRNRVREGLEWSRAAMAAARSQDESLAPMFFAAEFLWATGDLPGAAELMEKAAGAARATDDARWRGLIVGDLGMMAMLSGDYGEAARCFAEAAVLSEGNAEAWALAEMRLGRLAYIKGDYDTATHHNDEALASYRAMGNTWGIATAVANRADIALELGELDQARSAYLEAVATYLDGGFEWFAAGRCEGLANVLVEAGGFTAAARVYGLAQSWLDDLGLPVNPIVASSPAYRDKAMLALGEAFGVLLEEGGHIPRRMRSIEESTRVRSSEDRG